jgi:ribonuclease HI
MAAQEDLSNIMGVKHVLGTGNYLGLPSMIGRKKKDVFAYIKDRIWKRINSWRGRALSRAGKEVMIKSVLQAIPTYIMSIYLIPDSTIKEIERLMNSFWWGGGANNKGIRWLAWDRMTQSKKQGGMGFRDLQAFNLAMIAKQGWNILTKPHTLVAKLYKARYFPNSSLFDSTIGHNPSYAWRGIWKARQILMQGCRWRIGSGDNIRVMNDPWLRDGDGAWIPSPQAHCVYDLCVRDLMVPNSHIWDKGRIESLFPLHTAQRILEIPLLHTGTDDAIVWVDNTNGCYSVRSGYKIMLQMTKAENGVMQNEDWNCIWNIRAPPKAKHLLWRICKGCLPTRVRLQDKRVPCPLSCPLCNHSNEDDLHVLFECETSTLARQAAGLDSIILPRLQQVHSAREVVFSVCSTADVNTAGLFAVMVSVIWENRNNMVWNEAREQGRMLGYKAKQLWEDWNYVQQIQQGTTNISQQQQINTWVKPSLGWCKCNVDAAFHKEINKTSTGWVLRDHIGRFIAAETTWFDGNCSIVEGEAIALLNALQSMVQRGFSHVIFESDSKSVVDAIHHYRGGNSEFSVSVSNINNLLACNQNFLVKFVRRQANMVAHTLARAAISWPRCRTFERLPLCITRLLNNEMI